MVLVFVQLDFANVRRGRCGKLPGRAPDLERAAQAQPSTVEAQMALGVKLFRCGQPAAALEPLRMAIRLRRITAQHISTWA